MSSEGPLAATPQFRRVRASKRIDSGALAPAAHNPAGLDRARRTHAAHPRDLHVGGEHGRAAAGVGSPRAVMARGPVRERRPATRVAVLLVVSASCSPPTCSSMRRCRPPLGAARADGVAAVNALVLLAPPLLSTDVFSYQAYAGCGPLRHQSVPERAARLAASTPLSRTSAPSGSTHRRVTARCSRCSAGAGERVDNPNVAIAASALAYKAIASLSCLGTVAMLWNASRLRGLNPTRAVALFGLNPLVVLYGVGGGHNDLLMLDAHDGRRLRAAEHRERAGGALFVVAAGDQADRRAAASVRARLRRGLGARKRHRARS